MEKQIVMSTATSDSRLPVVTEPPPALDCAAFELQLAEHLERACLPPAACRHLDACPVCRALVESFEAIAVQVRQLPPHGLEPATNLWPQIADVLRREGVIHNDSSECRAASAPGPQLVHRTPAARR